MNRDIELQPTLYGQYDRVLYNNDFKSVDGLETLENNIIISLMTRLGELNHNPTYNGFGCSAYDYLKQNNIELTRIAIKETIKRDLQKIKAIKKIKNIQTHLENNNPYQIHVQIEIKTTHNTTLKLKTQIRV